MSMTVSCPSCNKSLRIGDENRGKKMRCPSCQQVFKAPMADGGHEDAAPSPSPPPRRDEVDDRPPRREEYQDERPSRRDDRDLDRERDDRPARRSYRDDDDGRSRRRDRDDDRPSRRPFRDDDYDDFRRGGRRQDVPNYLVPAILVTLFCCQIGGVISIIYAAQANSKAEASDYRGAMDAANTAKIWMWVSVGGWVVIVGLYMMLMLVSAAAK